jgi:cell division protein FtsL
MTPPAAAAAPAVTRPSRSATPRRRSGPARAPAPPARRSREQPAGLVGGAIGALGRLEDHRLLDRLISGRAWIALVAFALIGIVTLQLALLELNTSVGRSLEREAALQRENAALAIANSELAAGGRVESLASRLGMQLVPIGALRFLAADPATDAVRAAAALSAPAKAPADVAAEGTGEGDSQPAGGEASPDGQQAPAQAASTGEGDSQPAGGEAAPAAGTQAGATG